MNPDLTFFCELEPHALAALFDDPRLVEELTGLGAGISLALLDLSAERAAVVRKLNEAGVPVTAWLLLPRDQGYFLNLDNAPEAAAFYAAFKAWTAQHRLRWAAVGLDVEPDLRDMLRLPKEPWPVAWAWLRRAPDEARVRRGLAQYRDLVAQIRADGYAVESYVYSFLADEKGTGSQLLERLFGVMDLPVDRTVYMLYSSFLRGPGALWSYGPASQAVAVGSTGGGVDPSLPTLSWDELARDLRLAHCWTEQIYIYSLEGCRQQGYLKRLADFDWSQPVEAPFAAAGQVDMLRAGLRGLLWLAAHPAALLAVPAALILTRVLRRRD